MDWRGRTEWKTYRIESIKLKIWIEPFSFLFGISFEHLFHVSSLPFSSLGLGGVRLGRQHNWVVSRSVLFSGESIFFNCVRVADSRRSGSSITGLSRSVLFSGGTVLFNWDGASALNFVRIWTRRDVELRCVYTESRDVAGFEASYRVTPYLERQSVRTKDPTNKQKYWWVVVIPFPLSTNRRHSWIAGQWLIGGVCFGTKGNMLSWRVSAYGTFACIKSFPNLTQKKI